MTAPRAHDIAHLRAPNAGPYTLSGTNSWIVGRDPAYVVDPGPAVAGHLDALLAEVDARGGLGAILLTHDHGDHSGAVAELRARTGAPLAAMRPDAEIALADGVVVGPLTALSTPGHTPDHLAFLAGRVCFTGDAVLGEGSVFLAAYPGALAGYLAALRRLREEDLELLLPGHGPPITDPRGKLDEYLAHRLRRERAVLEALSDGLRDRDELLDRVWPRLPAPLRAAAASTLEAHLQKLADEGRLPHA
ncbi:MAG TPA: MBL fold metallo-hydrolase [Solirubrobacteraceae bacterium]|nr:MBL fold metallo-hydrolase [Solirubrobacteraceae bacterium]